MSEAKEFDEVIVPADKPKKEVKKEKKLETFDPPVEEKPKSEWQDFFDKENEKYAKIVKEKAEQNEYSLPIVNGDGTTKNTLFSRKRLSVAELRRLNSLQKEYNEKPVDDNSLFQAEALASLYLEYAQMLLVNNTTGEPMKKEEFETQDWGNIRALIDNCILKSLIGSTG